MSSFYQGRPSRTFWRGGVREAGPDFPELFQPKFRMDRTTKIATAGSCFAQNVGRALLKRGFTVMDVEPSPMPMAPDIAHRFGYGIYSARYGNIYTVRQLLQLVLELRGRHEPAEAVWEKDGRFYDALRPSVEPAGLASAELVQTHRNHHLRQVNKLFREMEVLVFTLGLTEQWEHSASGTVYPTAPGTIAGSHDPEVFGFRNLTYGEVYRDFVRLRSLLLRINPGLRFILTVSPVPLAATATNDHVLTATTYSKAVLRTVAGTLANEFDDVDYFPSYEIITSAASRGRFFGPDLRTVMAEGVELVMDHFFRAQSDDTTPEAAAPADIGAVAVHPAPAAEQRSVEDDEDDVVCEEALLEAFAK